MNHKYAELGEIGLAKSVLNPLHSGVSEAYLRSRENARRRSENSAEIFEEREKPERIGPKTIIVAITMFISGIVLFITGATIYWSSTGEEKNSQGLDILIVSAILLLPGSYAVYILYGVWKRWPGFSFHQIPSYD